MTASDLDLALIHAEYARLTAAESAELRRQTVRVSTYAILTAIVVPVTGLLLGGHIVSDGEIQGLAWAVWLVVVPAVAVGATAFASLSLTAVDLDSFRDARQRLRTAVSATSNPAAALLESSFVAMKGSRRGEIVRLALVVAVCNAILISLAAMTAVSVPVALIMGIPLALVLQLIWWASARPSALPPEWRAAFDDGE